MDRYKRYRYPISIISHVVWCYFRFGLSLRDVRRAYVCSRYYKLSHETIRSWSIKYGNLYAAEIKKRKPARGDRWHIDEMCIKKMVNVFGCVAKLSVEVKILMK